MESPYDLGLPLMPYPSGSQAMYTYYLDLYNSVRSIAQGTLEPQRLNSISKADLSYSAKAGRFYIRSSANLSYGDWVRVRPSDRRLEMFSGTHAITCLRPFNDDYPFFNFSQELLPLFVTSSKLIAPGEVAEVTCSGIVYVENQLLIPGKKYYLSNGQLVQFELGNNLHYLAGTPAIIIPVGFALSPNHFLIKRHM